jgi:flagellar motility protein MotE (MotC chaperone)
MIKLLAGLSSLFVYLAIGTVLFQSAGLLWAWRQGYLTTEKTQRALLVAYGLEPEDLKSSLQDEMLAPASLTYQEIRQYRSKMILDQDLRESSLVGSADDFRYIDAEYSERRRRLDRIRNDFEATMARLQGVATDKSLNEVRETIKSLKPDQAADQIVRMLELSRVSGDTRHRDDMVTILKTLPEATQRKLMAEFKTPERSAYLYEMLTQIRLGKPDVDAIRDTRDKLQQYRQRFLDLGVP